MTPTNHRPGGRLPIGHEDLRKVLPDLDDARALEVISLSPTIAEVEQAAVWAAGDGDILDRSGHPLHGKVARIFEILIRDQEPTDR